MIGDKEIRDILNKYGTKLGSNIGVDNVPDNSTFSREYEIFRKEALDKRETLYESLCKFAGKLITIKPKPKEEKELQNSINVCHLDITPGEAHSFSILIAFALVLLAVLIAIITLVLGNLKLFLPLFLILVGVVLIKPLSRIPNHLANRWRLQASNQMVLCILYVVMYMRHTSNLEHAIKFAGEHIGNPLALDLRKIFWDVQADKFSTIKESLDNYLETWRDYNLEFIESFHLIQGSLYEPSEERRIELLDKALSVILEGTYERMMHFAYNLKSPITMLHMLGIILPILGLVIFPLIASFMQGLVKWYHLAILYNILLPIFVYYVGTNLLAKRPTGYGESDILKTNPEYKKYQEVIVLRGREINISPGFISFLIAFVLVFIGFLPVLLHYTNPELDQAVFLQGSPLQGKLLDYKCDNSGCIGPYGLFSLILSLLVPLGLAFGLGIYYYLRTKNLIEIKRKTQKLETEFAGSLFQLGNRVADGIPVELAFEDVSENMKGTPTGNFFRLISVNIRRLGMSVNNAIFNKERGAILSFPSHLIESTMKVLVESARKGPQVVAKCLISISIYADKIHNVDERLKDLLADILSSMKSQISFLAPMIAGIVVGVASMVVAIINRLGEQFAQVQMGGVGGEAAGFNLGAMTSILNIKFVIPGFHFQLIVGLYVLEIIFILTILSNSIENGVDRLTQEYNLGKNLIRGTALYCIIALIGIIVFGILAKGIEIVTTAT